jgi:hypothetical protein
MCRHCSNGYILVTNWRHPSEGVHIRGHVVATIWSNRQYLILCPRDRKEANTTLIFSHEVLLAILIAAMKHRCCTSEDANVAKIDFMYFNPVRRDASRAVFLGIRESLIKLKVSCWQVTNPYNIIFAF